MLVAPVARIQRIHVRKVIGTRAINGLFHMPWLNLLPSRRFASRRSRTGFSWCRFWCGCGVAVVWLWCGCGVAVVWLWCGCGVAVVWLWCGCGVAVVWLWCGCGVAVVWLWCGCGVAVVWLWCGCGVAVVWLWCGFVLRSLCLVYAYYMALWWLWVASPVLKRSRVRDTSRKSENSVIMRIAGSSCLPLSAFKPFSNCSDRTSARATNLVAPAVLSAWLAAPVPRPPQPTRAIFNRSLPAAWALHSKGSAPNNVAPISAEEPVCRK